MRNNLSTAIRLLIALCLVMSIAWCPQRTVQASTYTFVVTSPAPPDSNDINPGDNICQDSSGKCSLRAALQEVNAGNSSDTFVVNLSAGVHQISLTPNLNIDKSVTINNNTGKLAMIRGTSNTGTININNIIGGSHVRMNHVTISEFQTGITHKQGLFTCTSCTIQYNNRGLYVANGEATLVSSLITENEGSHCTGAIIMGGTLTTLRTGFTFNTTTSTLETDRGGAVCNYNGNLYLREFSSIAYNTGITTDSRKNGGGLFHSSTFETSITESSIHGNEGRLGGGIYSNNGTLYIRSASQIYNNSASVDGGGAYLKNSTVYIEEAAEISKNIAAGYGGGILTDGDIRMNGVIIMENQALFGGGIYHLDALLRIDNSVIKSNISTSTMTGGGGGLYVASQFQLFITNTTISGNNAKFHGGGLYLAAGNVDLSNITITNNSCDYDLDSPNALAGGVYTGANALLYMRNSILAGNTDPTGTSKEHDITGILRSQGYNLIGSCGSVCSIASIPIGNIVGKPGSPIDPQLDDLAIHNYPRFTYYHPLRESSPAVQAGNPEGCKDSQGQLLLLDQLGEARSQAGRCDMGAAESPFSLPSFSVFLPLLTR